MLLGSCGPTAPARRGQEKKRCYPVGSPPWLQLQIHSQRPEQSRFPECSQDQLKEQVTPVSCTVWKELVVGAGNVPGSPLWRIELRHQFEMMFTSVSDFRDTSYRGAHYCVRKQASFSVSNKLRIVMDDSETECSSRLQPSPQHSRRLMTHLRRKLV
jgi:hypothetical protein